MSNDEKIKWLRFPNGLNLPVWSTGVQGALEFHKDFDATPVERTLETRAAALLALIEDKAGKGARGALRPSEVLALTAKYGVDSVQKIINGGVITGF